MFISARIIRTTIAIAASRRRHVPPRRARTFIPARSQRLYRRRSARRGRGPERRMSLGPDRAGTRCRSGQWRDRNVQVRDLAGSGGVDRAAVRHLAKRRSLTRKGEG